MWNTPGGVRKLVGAESRLFVIAVGSQVDYIVDGDGELEFVAPILNHISPPDRRYVFLKVAEDLLGDGPAPDLAAWNEAVVWETYEQMKSMVEMNPDDQFYRQAILDALNELYPDDKADFPKLKNKSAKRWMEEVDAVAMGVLHDEDFLNYDDFADAPPKAADAAKKRLRIEPDYYAAIPPMFTVGDKARLDLLRKALNNQSNIWSRNYEKTGRLL